MNIMISAVSDKLIPSIILAVYLLMMVGIAVLCRKRSRSLDDFFLAGRGLGGWMSAFSYGTTYFSSVIFVGYAGKFGWTMGLGAIWIGVGNALIGAFCAWRFLANRTRVITHKLGARTMPEYFATRYNDKGLKLLSAIIIFTFLIPYSASVYQGLGYLFELVFGIDSIWCIVIMAIVTALYLFFGGYFATSLSDFIQGIIMIIGVIVMVVLIMNAPEVNWGEGLSTLWEEGFGLAPSTEGGWDSPMFNMIILVILTSFGVWGLPQSVHKFYAVKSKKAVNQAMIVSTMFCLVIGFGAYFTGAMGRLFFDVPPGGNFDMLIPTMLYTALPSAVLGLIVVLVLSASMSTLASLSLSGASSVAVDAYKGFIKKDATDKEVNWVLRGFCLFFVLTSVVLAIFELSAIVTLMSLSWGVLAGCFIGPYVLGLYSKKVNKYGVYTSMISCLVTTFVLVFVFGAISPAKGSTGILAIINGGIGRSPLIGVICMVMSVILTYVVSICTHDKNNIGEEIIEYAKIAIAKKEDDIEDDIAFVSENAEEICVSDQKMNAENDLIIASSEDLDTDSDMVSPTNSDI